MYTIGSYNAIIMLVNCTQHIQYVWANCNWESLRRAPHWSWLQPKFLGLQCSGMCVAFVTSMFPRTFLITHRVSAQWRQCPIAALWRLTVWLINYSQNVYKHCAKKEYAMTLWRPVIDAKHCSFLWVLYPMSGTTQLDASNQDWRGTNIKTALQISDTLYQ